ncbi:MAG: protein kinase [Candidatus Aminicenantes bacterium]|nr:protein kinase [Candidatus Aminicenantes bacterium]
MKCPKCHFENLDNTRFCGECGTQLRPQNMIIISPDETLQIPIMGLNRGAIFANRYEFIEELGKGGMGRVYKVFDKKTKEDIALKILKPEIAGDKEILERFSNELTFARKIVHKNVARMFDLNEQDGTCYITMEYIPGEDLKSFIKRVGQLPIRKAVDIAKQVCEGLAEAHKLGIVHRDLKPKNVMIDQDGNAKIMDFGIARSLKKNRITKTAVLIGTPDYMAPELAEGKEADERSDIYALGIVLYEMVTGRLPFEGDTALTIALKHKTETPIDPREFNPQVPEDLSLVILKCLEKNKENRFQRVEDLLKALNRLETGVTTVDRVPLGKTTKEEKITEKKWEKSIAVLPFDDSSSQRDQGYFCEGLADELINALTKIKDLRVVARTSAFAFRGEKLDVREIGKRLNVDTVLEGSVRKAGNRLRVTTQLINVADGYHLWSERYDHDMEDIFTIQDDIAKATVEALKIKLGGEGKEKLVRHYTEDIEAYSLYLKARHFHHMFTEEYMKKAIEYFYLAITKDSNNALAYAGLANHYNQLGILGFIPPKEAFLQASGMAQKALGIDNTLAEAHCSLASVKFWLEWDWDKAEKAFQQAIELSPGSAVTYLEYSIFLAARGRSEEAIATARHAVELDPLSPSTVQNLGRIYFEAERFDESITHLKKALELNPNYAWAHGEMAWDYAFMGKIPEALDASKKVKLLYSEFSPWLCSTLAYVHAVSGEKNEVRKTLERLRQLSHERYIDPINFAILYAGLEEIDEAFNWLAQSYQNRSPLMVFLDNFSHTWLKSLASDERYKEILKKVEFGK